MRPVMVTAAVAVLLMAVLGAMALTTGRRHRRARRDDVERGPDDEEMRAEVAERLRRAAARWDGRADPELTDPTIHVRKDPATWNGPSHAEEEGRPRRGSPLAWVFVVLVAVTVMGVAALAWLPRG